MTLTFPSSEGAEGFSRPEGAEGGQSGKVYFHPYRTDPKEGGPLSLFRALTHSLSVWPIHTFLGDCLFFGQKSGS